MTAGPVRISILRFSPALILFAIVIADARQATDPDLWGHVMWGRELLAHGSLPRGNPYSYSAPNFRWLRHEWLSEVLMAAMFDTLGPIGLKLLKFACTAGTICFVASAESECGAPAMWQATILLVVALILAPVMQFRPQLFDFLSLSAIIALLSRHNWRGSAPLWLAIPIVAVWSNLHGGFFVGIVVMGVYGATVLLRDVLLVAGPRRGLGIIAITAAAAASTLCTFLIPPARDTWYTLIRSIMNPMTHFAIEDWKPLLVAVTSADSGSVAQKYFVVVLFFFGAAVVSVLLTPKGGDAPLIAVGAVIARISLRRRAQYSDRRDRDRPVFANHLGLLIGRRDQVTPHPLRALARGRAWDDGHGNSNRGRCDYFARHDGVLTPGIDAKGNPCAPSTSCKVTGSRATSSRNTDGASTSFGTARPA